ncbi:hypothetical protein NX801_09915 [Streptomyces sp. LP05-1]|uniref:Secreted protein n=1 Tax=Streptomyces pyxinae TaxID=2970734 RepID=A0ABT2CF00_9ACTN|nr:hypothetical protein [Streptomyces sp. LP05-1]MCS0635975.1 hypothetical protein [Streptomyces sp. LP05-1]
MRTSSRLGALLAALSALVGAVAAPATAAARPTAAVLNVICPVGSNISTYTPGLTYTAKPTHFAATGQVSGCVSLGNPTLTGANFTAAGDGIASCIAGSFTNTGVYHWNTGQSSTVVGTGSIDLRPNGETVFVLVGKVTSGLFNGANVVQTKILLSTDLTACLTPQGLTSIAGPITLTIT